MTLNSTGTNDLQLLYPTGGIENLTAQTDANGALLSELKAPAGAPYFVRGLPGDDTTYNGNGSVKDVASHNWKWVEVVWDDGSVFRFEPKDDYVYRLVKTTTPTGQNLLFGYDGPNEANNTLASFFANSQLADPASYVALVGAVFHGENPSRAWRLSTIKNDAGDTLLSLDYRTSDGRLNAVTDLYGRKVYYAWSQPTGFSEPLLTGVSQIFQSGFDTASTSLDSYGYVPFGASPATVPLLATITRVHPNGIASGTVTSTDTYDALGRVASTRDANGVTRTFTYGIGQTQIMVSDPANNVAKTWTRFTNGELDAGYADADGHRWSVFYEDAANPLRPTRMRDPMGRESLMQYDTFGHLIKSTSPRGVVTTYTYAYDVWRMGRLMSAQVTTPTQSLPAVNFTYYEPSGLVQTVTGPHPDGTGTVSTSYDYDAAGNVLSVVEPGLGTTGMRTTQFSYSVDGTETLAPWLGQPVAVQDNLGHITHLRYDSHGNLTAVKDALGNISNTVYDPFDRPISQIAPATNQTGTGQGEVRTTYAFRGGPVVRSELLDESGATTRALMLNYGNEGEVLGQSGDQLSQSTVYDAVYRPISMLDGQGGQTRWSYDVDGRLEQMRLPGADATGKDTQTNTYDASGLMLSSTDGRGITTSASYDASGLPTAISYSGPNGATYPTENVALGYDSLGRLTGRANGQASELYGYNAAGTLNSQQTTYLKADGTALPTWARAFSYNADGSRAGMTTPLGALGYGYDGAGRLVSQSDWTGRQAQWSYLDNDWLAQSQLPTGGRTQMSYNAAGQLTAQRLWHTAGGVSNPFASWGDMGNPSDPATQLRYNASGQMIRQTAFAQNTNYAFAGTTNYGYNARTQLTGEATTRGASISHAYGYDGAGNPTNWRGRTRTFNAQNQETTGIMGGAGISGNTSAYDGDGNARFWQNYSLFTTLNPDSTKSVTEASRRYFLSYSAQGQMVQVSSLNNNGTPGGLFQKNGYDASGKRVWKENASGARTYFYYDGEQLCGVVGATNTGTLGQPTVYLWGADGMYGYRTRGTNGAESGGYFNWDPQGNLVSQTDLFGGRIGPSSYGWTAYGQPLPDATNTSTEAPFGYGGKFGYLRDSETFLILCTHRFYDPSSGSWTQRDPIGIAGGQNLYGYVGGDPVNMMDMLGFLEKPIAFVGVGDTNVSDGPVASFFNRFGMNEGQNGINAAVQLEMSSAKSYLESKGYHVVVDNKLSWETIKRIGKNSRVKALFFIGHADVDSGAGLPIFSDGAGGWGKLSPSDIVKGLGGRKLDWVTLHSCDTNNKALRDAFTGKTGKWWAPHGAYNIGSGQVW